MSLFASSALLCATVLAGAPKVPPPAAPTVREAIAQLKAERVALPRVELNPALATDATTDYAAQLVQRGALLEAMRILLGVEQRLAGGYGTALLLGTVYERLGNLEKAAAWIAEAIQRNPFSPGTERMRLLALQARLR